LKLWYFKFFIFIKSIGIREGDFIIAIQDNDVRWSKHVQVVEKIRSHTNTVKLTLISIQPLSKDPSTLNEVHQNKDKMSFQFQERPVIVESEKNVENKTQPSKTTKPIIVQSSKTIGPAAGSKSQKLRHRFFRLPESTAGLSKCAADTFLENDNAAIAASKLASLAKSSNIPHLSFSFRDKNSVILSNSKNLFSKSRNNVSIFKSTTTLNHNESEPIAFNKEDDEIIDKENALFWNNLKSLKTNFTNTITLGRKFKKNVLKLNIFNSFSLNNNNAQNSTKSQPKSATNLDNGVLSPKLNDETMSSALIHTKPPVNPKLLKKQKRLKELEKCLMNISNKDKILLKTCNNTSEASTEKSLIYKTI